MDTPAKTRIDKLSPGVINKKCHGIFHRDTNEKNGVKDFPEHSTLFSLTDD